jgi:uncharacterized membrane protein YqaE (UPF0057 family)
MKLVFVFILMIATTTFAQSDIEGVKVETAIENQAASEADDSAPEMNEVESSEVSKEKRLSFRETLKDLKRDLKDNLKATKKISKEKRKSSNGFSSSVPLVLLIILAIILPWLAVGLYTDWDLTFTLIAFFLWLLFLLPGIIFAFLVIFDVIG